MRGNLAPRKSCQTWPAVLALVCYSILPSSYEGENTVVRWNLLQSCVDTASSAGSAPRGLVATAAPARRAQLMAAARVAALLMKHKATVAVAESSAGGAISRSLVAVRGASNYFAGSTVCYTAASKHTLLGLTPAKPTATEAHAKELAMAVRERLSADWGIGETGVAGPGKNSRGVAPGVCAIAVVGPGVSKTLMLFPDSTLSAADAYGQAPLMPREQAMETFGERALELLETALSDDSSS